MCVLKGMYEQFAEGGCMTTLRKAGTDVCYYRYV